ncbi:MAG: restriction endonuclease subunit S [Desulfobulbus sp.]|nr:restriction endonuclease subunit S [Desulfobulbus sp.]
MKGIPAGYKQTEVGVIPEDWEILNLESITDPKRSISYGIVQTGPNIQNGIRCLRVVDIEDGKINSGDMITTSKTISDSYKRTILQAEDLVMPLRGKVGDIAIVNDELSGCNLTRGVALIAVRPDWSARYCRQYISSSSTRNRLEQSMNGSALQEIPIASLRSFKIALPPTKAEQEAIAEVLSDTDGLIESLEQLIAKKRYLRQGVMQELLTGKKRLPGFRGEWSTVCMRDILVQNATYGIVTAGTFVQNGTKMLRGGDIVDGRVSLDLPMVSREKALEYTRTTLMKDDVVISLVGYPGATAKIPNELIGANISRAVGLLRLNGKVSPDYLVCLLNSTDGRRMVLAPSAGSAQLVVNLAALNRLEFSVPEHEEQTAIAAILSAMDAEIAALETKLAKTRQLKQGMMHNLLTGRIRLL